MSTSSHKQGPFSFLNFCARWPVTSSTYVTLSGPFCQVEDADFQPARYPGILGLECLWPRGSGMGPVPSHCRTHSQQPLIHLTQQEALKLPFQCPSPACCGLGAFLYHSWQELCYTSWRELPLERGHLASGSFLLLAGSLFPRVPCPSPGVTLPVHCLGVSWHVQPWLNHTKVPHCSGGGERRIQRGWAGLWGLGTRGRQEWPLAVCHLPF